MQQNEYRHLRIKQITFLIVILLAALTFAFIAQQIVAFRDYPFDTDEANHANSGLALYLILQEGDVAGFVREFYGQGFYPPGISWILAIAFTIFGVSTTVARLFSTVSLFLAMLVMFALSLELDEMHGWLVGLVAVILTLASQSILVNSAMAMMEIPGLLVSLLWLWAYVRALKRSSPRRLLLTSLLLALTFLTKYTFGVITLTTVIMMELSQVWLLWFENREMPLFNFLQQRFKQRWLWLLGPFILIMLMWFGRPDKLANFLDYTRPLDSSEPWLSIKNLFFYPRSLALHYSPSPLFAWVILLGVFWAIANRRVATVRLLLIYFLTGMALIMLVNHPANQRFIATVAPAAHLLTGLMLARGIAFWQKNRTRWRFVFTVAGIGFMLLVGLSVPVFLGKLVAFSSLMSATYETNPRLTDIATWIETQIPDHERFYLINYWDQFNPQTLAWNLGTQAMSPIRYSDLVMPATLLEPASPQNIAALKQSIIDSNVQYLVLIEGSPWGAPFWPDYTAALSSDLVLIAQEKFSVDLYGGEYWIGNNLLKPDDWERKKAESSYTLDIQIIIYQIQ